MRVALIKNYLTIDVIEAEQNFIDSIKEDYDYCVEAPIEVPGAGSRGDIYDPKTGLFTRPEVS